MRWKPGTKGVDWLHAGFSERAGGVSAVYGGGALNLGWTQADIPESVAENRRRWMAAVWEDGATGESVSVQATRRMPPELVTLVQVHSAESLVVLQDPPRVDHEGQTDGSRIDTGRITLRGDGLMTAEPDVLLGIQTADCVPVLVADVRLRAVAAFHAGWRGTAGRIVERGLAQMAEVFGSRPEDLWAAVGPAIAGCCYSVGEEVRERFGTEFRYADELFTRRSGVPQWERLSRDAGREHAAAEDEPSGSSHLFLDLHESNRRQLLSAGVPPEQIDMFRECTACTRTDQGAPRYFSYRAEQGKTGRMMALIGVRAA